MAPENKTLQENGFYIMVIELTGKVFIDKTGSLPVTSRQGYKYIITM